MEKDTKKDFIKAVVPIIMGAIAGIISYFVTQDVRQRDPFGIIVLVAFIHLQKFILSKFDIQPESKEWAGFALMTFSSWYISWTFMLNL